MGYTVDAEGGLDCLKEMFATIKKKDIDVVFPMEFRYIREGDIAISQFSGKPSAAISIQKFHNKPYKEYFNAMEKIADSYTPYGAHPHWRETAQ